MTLRLIQAATTLPVSVDLAKRNSRIETDVEDELVELWIKSAHRWCEDYCGIAFEPSTWEIWLDAFPEAEIEIPYSPLVEISSIKLDTDAGEAVVGSENYEIDLNGWVLPVTGYSWPAPLTSANSVRIRFVAGTGTPEDVKIAVLMLVEHYNANRAATGEKVETIPLGVVSHLERHRRLFV